MELLQFMTYAKILQKTCSKSRKVTITFRSDLKNILKQFGILNKDKVSSR
ncbi:hypothetical protein LEP1GSC158_4291 [Leptospira interrogans serovar Zanoni str. LT2156]|uniref:Uncharacterized protein n=1 Tax=Leptospira interrogans serovar Zanoni str. LT2156 TaxID=1001601 RepID=M6HF94_LEPIR|nr:hypothetical protein LEP1GSC158_4291 [Leptospira interrogans serovar Zanoni str. LT2156]